MRLREPLRASVRTSSLAALAALVPHYVLFYAANTPLLTDQIAEWIMARTPARDTVFLLAALGSWAKPLAETGALAAIGLAVFVARLAGSVATRTQAWLGTQFGSGDWGGTCIELVLRVLIGLGRTRVLDSCVGDNFAASLRKANTRKS